jgi:hypothetical protein
MVIRSRPIKPLLSKLYSKESEEDPGLGGILFILIVSLLIILLLWASPLL